MNNLHLRDGKIAFRWKRWRNKKRQEVSYCLMVLFSGAVLFGGGGVALAGPSGGQVTSGTGTINQSGTTTTIDQTSNVLNINWQTFSTAPDETVNFVQPGSTSIAINRVVGGVPSYLQGALNANGRVFILNSAGITFAGTSRVNVGALLATTAMSVDGNVSGLSNFSAPSGSGGSVINQGSITVSNGGFAILAAPYVQNTGFIQANLGTVTLAGTNQFTLDLRGDGLINFVVPPGTAAQIAADGQKVGVDNSGTLRAQSGQVIISANVATQVVNAVVNMTGVVDADALSGSGAGGSVLVTSTGDINLGGTITAQGNGTGAGGQIVTKAAGRDNVEAAAVLVAAGAPGEGGHIEVSGHRVVLSGDIEAGSGGSLLIDPMNINVTTTPGHATSAVISESLIHGKLAAGTAVSLIAQHNVLFTATGPSHTLTGGKGDLLVQADTGNIDFNAGNYEIRTGSGNITFNTPAGSIGDASHRLSVVSGAGPDMPGVTQAGDVVLNAGESTFLGNVIVKSIATGGGERTAIYQDHAGIGIAVAGAIEVEASATGNGAEASALANLFANGDITVGGPITILANAHGSGGNVKADAALIAAESHTLSGNSIRTGGASSIDFHHAVDVEAKAISVTDGIPVKADAQARTLLAARRVEVDGPARVKATASGSNLGAVAANGLSSGNITACATLTAEDGTLDFAHGYYHRHVGANDVLFGSPVDVEAKALGGSNLIDFRGAFASAELYGVDIAVHGEATVKASAENGGAGLDIADARLVDAGSANSQAYGQYLHDFPASSIAFKLGIDVEAHANGGSIANAADGTALVALAGHDITVGGSVDVKAGAAGHGSSSRLANAVQAHARFVVGNEILRQDSANAFHELYAVPRNFASNVFLRKAFDVEASATGSDIGNGEQIGR